MRIIILAILGVYLTACTQMPDIPGPKRGLVSGDDYPTLVPLENIALETRADALTGQNVAARVAGLRARAARLRKVSFD